MSRSTQRLAVAPFVVVPADELEEVAVQLDTTCRPSKMLERVLWMKSLETTSSVGVAEDALQVGLAGLLHGGADFLEAGVLGGLDGEVDDGDGRGRHAEGHAGELALHSREQTRATALAAPVVLGMMLMAALRPPFQSFLEGPSTVFWVAV